jgi:hypothetical protein
VSAGTYGVQFGGAACFGRVTSGPRVPSSLGQMNSGEERGLPDSGVPTLPNTQTPDGRFFFDGHKWQAVPLPPEVAKRRRRMPSALIWLLIGIGAIEGGAILFEIIVTIGLGATHELRR